MTAKRSGKGNSLVFRWQLYLAVMPIITAIFSTFPKGPKLWPFLSCLTIPSQTDPLRPRIPDKPTPQEDLQRGFRDLLHYRGPPAPGRRCIHTQNIAIFPFFPPFRNFIFSVAFPLKQSSLLGGSPSCPLSLSISYLTIYFFHEASKIALESF